MGVARVVILWCFYGFVLSVEKSWEICPSLGNYIDCSQKNFTIIPTDIPPWATGLNLANNNIKTVTALGLSTLSNLSKLELNKNKITSISNDAFSNNTALETLDLSKNRINTIVSLTFKTMSNLRDLNLKRNNISDLGDATFFGLSKIKVLALDNNYIQGIGKKWLYGLESLEKLFLSYNRISTIDSDAWERCQNLKELNLASNKLTTINKNTFLKLRNLMRLNLNNNSISYIDDGAFSNTPKLKILHLSYNKIHATVEDATGVFKGLGNLEKFFVAANNIKSVKKNAFNGLSKLKFLDLNQNNITSVQKNAFMELASLQVLLINTSSLLCDCNLHWFYNWLRAEKKFDAKKSRIICAYPDNLKNQSLLSLSAHNFTCDNFVKPRLTQQPEAEIMALKGESVSLSCKAISSSTNAMSFLWKKDGKEISNPNVTNLASTSNGKNTESTSILNIHQVNQSDSGKYQCIVSNSFGAVYSSKCNLSVLIYPEFVKFPKNITAQNGKDVRLECGATGEPKPEIAWQKDGGNDFHAARERRLQVSTTDDDVFFILNVKPIDVGVYSCTAHNAAGKIVANATVTVEEMPYFSKKMEDCEVIAGELVVLKCMAGGQPKPTIQWLKNGEPINRTERHFFTAEDQVMIITDAVLKDAGTYQCVLNNSLGVSNGSSVLAVTPGVNNTKPDIIIDKMGIIVITVVCCAVATSIVWIIIIYQARKRMRPAGSGNVTQDPMIIEFTEKATHFADNTSEHSSCKDSGTGDSAKRSNDDLLPENEYTLIINNVNTVDAPTTMRAASLVYVPADPANDSHAPLLHTDCPTFPRSTNHDRLPNKQSETVIIEKFPVENSEEG